MGFVDRQPVLWAVLAGGSTTALLLIGNGMNPVWPVMWVAFLPVLWLAAETKRWGVAAGVAAGSFLLGSLHLLYYLHIVLHAPVLAWFVPLSIASSLFAVGVILFHALIRRRAAHSAVVALPAFWTVCEFLGSFAPANGTAGSLAYTQEGFLPILQIASVTGLWGISFLLLLFPSAVVVAVHLRRKQDPRAWRVAGSVLAVLLVAILFGVVRLAAPRPKQTVKVGLLDTDSVIFAEQAPAMQELVQRYAVQATRLAGEGARFIVMPEKTGLLVDANRQSVDAVMQGVSDRTGATLVIGMLREAGSDAFNEARIYTAERPVATYDKEHMLPPFESKLTPGTALTRVPGSTAGVGVAICKDMDFINPALEYGRSGIDLLLDPAWDFNVDRGWHGHIAIMRGVEGGYAIAHAAKDGFLTATDDRGRILGEVRTDQGEFASLLVDVPLHYDRTVFDRYGTWFPWLAGLLLVAVVMRLGMVSWGSGGRHVAA